MIATEIEIIHTHTFAYTYNINLWETFSTQSQLIAATGNE